MNRTSHTLRQRVAVLRWAFPAVLAMLAALYELGLARWVHNRYGDAAHFGIEIVFFSTAGPLLAFWLLTLIGRWFDDKERAEKQARSSEQRLASITAASADAILSLDPAGHIESWNLGAELLFGCMADQMRGQPFSNLFGDGERPEVEFRWLAKIVRQAGFVRGHEMTCRDVSGRTVAVELTATHLADEAGQPGGMSVILRDITNRKRREEEIRRLNASLNEQVAERTRELAEKVEELNRANADLKKLDKMRSEFVSLVSHQIRAPLTNMQGAVERMQASCSAVSPTCSRMFAILNQQAERLDRLVQDVLSAARLEAGELLLHPEPVSVLPIVQQVVDQTRARTAERAFRLPTKPGLPLVFADRDRVAEVFANLLDNADKYSPAGKEVIIDVRADQSEVTLSVRDFGPGLPASDLERVFEKFYRTDSSDSQAAYGYGLGLYVCRRLVEAQGGRIWAENHPNGGAVFSFALPVSGITVTHQTILLIDDDKTLLELLSGHLETAGYHPLLADDGPSGLRLATEAQPDLVALDVMMPGTDGWEVCRRLRENSSVPIIMLTGKGEEIDKLRGFRLGVDDYVTKPFSFAELTARVGAVLARAKYAPASAHSVTSSDLTIDFVQHRVTVAGQAVSLTPTEYRLLERLARHAHRTVPTEQLLADVWGSEYAGEVEHVKQYVSTLRKKIEADPGDPKHLITERGFGYRFE